MALFLCSPYSLLDFPQGYEPKMRIERAGVTVFSSLVPIPLFLPPVFLPGSPPKFPFSVFCETNPSLDGKKFYSIFFNRKDEITGGSLVKYFH